MSKFCCECGKELDENAKFCPECGTKVIKDMSFSAQEQETDILVEEKITLFGSTKNMTLQNDSIIFHNGIKPVELEGRRIKLKDIVQIKYQKYEGEKKKNGIVTFCDKNGNGIEIISSKEALSNPNSFEILAGSSKKIEMVLEKINTILSAQSLIYQGISSYAFDVEEKNKVAVSKVQDNVCKCPICGSTSLSSHKKGFGIGKAVIGAGLFGPLGLAAGGIGAKKVRVTCINCGYEFFAGKRLM